MTAAPPIDTFAFTINRTPYTPPLLVVSYNDAQGNHKFTSDAEVDSLLTNMGVFQGTMRHGLQLDVMAETAAQAGSNTVHLIFNNPSSTTLSGTSLFVEFATPDGTVAKDVG